MRHLATRVATMLRQHLFPTLRIPPNLHALVPMPTATVCHTEMCLELHETCKGIPWWSIHSCNLWMFIQFSPSNYDLLELLIHPHLWIILDICLVGYITPKYDVLNISKHHRPRSHRRKSQQVQPLLHAQRPISVEKCTDPGYRRVPKPQGLSQSKIPWFRI